VATKRESRKRPSDAYLQQIGLSSRELDRLSPETLALYASLERAEQWLRRYAIPVEPAPDQVDAWGEACRNADDDHAGVRWWWETHNLIAYGVGDQWLWRPRTMPPPHVIDAFVTAPQAPPTAIDESVTAQTRQRPYGFEAVRGVLAAIQSGGRGWELGTDGAPDYWWTGASNTVMTTVRGTLTSDDEAALQSSLWSVARSLDDNDGDVLLIALAHAIDHQRHQPDGTVWLNADSVLDYRNLVPKMRRNKGGGYVRHGHRAEDRADVAASMEHLDRLFVTLQERRNGAHAEAYETKLMLVIGRAVQKRLETGERQILSWRYRLGEWIDTGSEVHPHLAALLHKAVRYDRHNELWEKRLARFVTLVGCGDAHARKRQIVCTVQRLLDDTQLLAHCDPGRPREDRCRLEKALDRLRDDGVLADEVDGRGSLLAPAWAYTPDAQDILARLPRYNWAEKWQQATLCLTLPSMAQRLPVPLMPIVTPPAAIVTPPATITAPHTRGRSRKKPLPPQP